MQPLLAVTTTVHYRAPEKQRPEVSLYAAYISLFEQQGIASVLVTPAHTIASVRTLVGLSHGLLLTGGEDVDPARYGEDPRPELGALNPERDAMELAALDAALALDLPVLAICRGCQMLNVYFGGTLYQDVDAQLGTEVAHEQAGPWGSRAHQASIESGSLLERLIGERDLRINSYHHQAVKDVAPPLQAVAWAEDGIVEAVEHRERPWVLGVQWHPERHEASAREHADPDVRLMTAFAEKVREHASRVARA